MDMQGGEKDENVLRRRWIEIQAKWLRRPASVEKPRRRAQVKR
jgi:hypothetical protein